jgi:prophage regulatory protein
MTQNSTKILRLPAVMATTGMSATTIYSQMKDGLFPRQVPIGSQAVGWVESEIQDWIDDCIARRDDGPC